MCRSPTGIRASAVQRTAGSDATRLDTTVPVFTDLWVSTRAGERQLGLPQGRP
jgi:hypothetical protein